MMNSLKAALWTTLFTFIATAGMALLGLLASVQEALNSGTEVDYSTFTKLIFAAVISGASGLVNWAVRAAQSSGKLPGNGPTYAPQD